MDGFATDNACDWPVWGLNQDAVGSQSRGIEATNRSEIEKALLVDIANKKTNFIAMGCQHHTRLRGGMECCDYITMDIGTYFIRRVPQFFANNLLYRLFKTGRARAID